MFDLVLELDLLRHRDAVLGDRGVTELLVDDYVPALRAERDLHRLGQLVHATLQPGAGLYIEFEPLCRHVQFLLEDLSRAWR